MNDDHDSEYERHIYTHTIPRIQNQRKRRFRNVLIGIGVGLLAGAIIAAIVSSAGLAIPVLVGIGIAVGVVVGTSTAWGIHHRDKYFPKTFTEKPVVQEEAPVKAKVEKAPVFNFIARWKLRLPTSKISALSKIDNKKLAMAIEAKYRSVSKDTVPLKEVPNSSMLRDFVNAINRKLGDGDGLSYNDYKEIVMDFQEKSPSFLSLFDIPRESFEPEKPFRPDKRQQPEQEVELKAQNRERNA